MNIEPICIACGHLLSVHRSDLFRSWCTERVPVTEGAPMWCGTKPCDCAGIRAYSCSEEQFTPVAGDESLYMMEVVGI